MRRPWSWLVSLLDGSPLTPATRLAAYTRVCATPVLGPVGHHLTQSGRPEAEQVKRALHVAHCARRLHELRPGDEGVVRAAQRARVRRATPTRRVVVMPRRTA